MPEFPLEFVSAMLPTTAVSVVAIWLVRIGRQLPMNEREQLVHAITKWQQEP